MLDLGVVYPDVPVNVAETLDWDCSHLQQRDRRSDHQASGPLTGGVMCLSLTRCHYGICPTVHLYLHGPPLRNVWSLLAHSGLVGAEYDIDSRGHRVPCVWVTHCGKEANG